MRTNLNPAAATTTCSTTNASARRRAQAIAARDEPSLERFLPMRGDGVMLGATDIDTYRACPLQATSSRAFSGSRRSRPSTSASGSSYTRCSSASTPSGEDVGPLADLLGLLDVAWRRGGFGDSEEERQLRGKAAAALARYHERAQTDPGRPVWFERQFAFKLGPHLLRGRVDRVDRLPGGEYELIDYKTGRPKTAAQLAEDVQLSLYAIGAREAWSLEAGRGAYYYLLDDLKVTVPADGRSRSGSGGRGRCGRADPRAGVRATPSARGVLDLRLPPRVPGGRER